MMVNCAECGNEFDFKSDAIICAKEDAKRAELTRLRAANADLQERLSASEEQLSSARNALIRDPIAVERDQLRVQLADRDAELAEARRELSGAEDQYDRQRDRAKAAERELAEARDKNRDLNRRCQQMESLVSDFKWCSERYRAKDAGPGWEGIRAANRACEEIAELTATVERLWWQSFAGVWEAIGNELIWRRLLSGRDADLALANQSAIDHAERARAQEQRDRGNVIAISTEEEIETAKAQGREPHTVGFKKTDIIDEPR